MLRCGPPDRTLVGEQHLRHCNDDSAVQSCDSMTKSMGLLVLNNHGLEILVTCHDGVVAFPVSVLHMPNVAWANVSDFTVAGCDPNTASQTNQFLRNWCRVDRFIPA